MLKCFQLSTLSPITYQDHLFHISYPKRKNVKRKKKKWISKNFKRTLSHTKTEAATCVHGIRSSHRKQRSFHHPHGIRESSCLNFLFFSEKLAWVKCRTSTHNYFEANPHLTMNSAELNGSFFENETLTEQNDSKHDWSIIRINLSS